MKTYKFNTVNSGEIELTEFDMMNIHQAYMTIQTMSYIAEMFPTASEEELEVLASDIREAMMKNDFTEDEAIEYVLDSYVKGTIYMDSDNDLEVSNKLFVKEKFGGTDTDSESGILTDKLYVRYRAIHAKEVEEWCINNDLKCNLSEEE